MRPASRFLVLVALGILLSTTSPAVASCAAGAGPAGSPTIFVGVAGPTSGGYTTMRVEEVWAGRDLPMRVHVLSGQTQPNVSSSIDADLERGHRYVIGADTKLRTNACSITEVDSAEVTKALRPDHVRQPFSRADGDFGDTDSPDTTAIVAIGLLLALTTALGVAVVRSRR
ncbi:hypothetical protein ASE12_17245 [Aeromicrobium sp. Root236]|uniref:hypothetical protein n=1 Tax=Aeromicrobium sp. Root236 TaxID=1736498 RepID=UPI0006F8E03C|nr:hypothetical protein [Aeromicrobium sp. Root236]KRC66349.1 hypothetical protein ASE12_17245 [Aeromicrobium sp. Root236]